MTATTTAVAEEQDDVQPVANENLDRFLTGAITVVPFLCLGIVAWQLWSSLLGWSDVIVFLVMYVATGLGITVGFHRLFTHRAFKTGKAVRAVLAVLGSAAIEGPVISWVADHRKHHVFSDRPGDPHSPHVDHGHGLKGALRGLFHAHVGWLFIHTQRGLKTRYAPDLIADPVVNYVSRTFPLWILAGLAVPFGLGWAIGGTLADALTGLLWGGAVRMLVLHHSTYSINSLCHFFGRRQFKTNDQSRNLFWLAPLTFGEAWHNNHHAFPTSARHGLKAWQFDPSAIVIWGLEKTGLAWDVVRNPARTPSRQARRMKTLPDLRAALAAALPDRPFRIELWDGSAIEPTNGGGPTFRITTPEAFGHVLRSPGQLGLGRAYVSGGIETDDLDAALALLARWSPPPVDTRAKAEIALAAVRAGALRSVPQIPEMELRPKGKRHSLLRDRRAVTHHYDLSNEFFALFLDESMTYSCAVWRGGPDETLEEAQFAKRELVCTKLALKAGDRVLDVGCGWGAFAIHAATEHGVHVTGITLSEPQARLARERAAAAGVADKVDIRVMDYREIAGETFDAIASIGMVEHVGSVNIDAYAAKLAALLKPGGRLLNHGIARLRVGDAEAGPFSERYVFPDAAPLHLSRIQLALERAGFVTHHVEGFAPDYARTLTEWLKRFESNLEAAKRLGGEERVRVWRIYLRVSRQGFQSGFIGIYQVRASLPC